VWKRERKDGGELERETARSMKGERQETGRQRVRVGVEGGDRKGNEGEREGVKIMGGWRGSIKTLQ
jgi:hypothetical protein